MFVYETFGSDWIKIIGFKEGYFTPNLKIPERIDNKEVKRIGYAAFRGLGLESIELPLGLEHIEEQAFKRNELKCIEMPDSLSWICEDAFSMNSIEEIVFSKKLRVIEDETFCGNNLKHLSIPEGIVKIGQLAFSYNDLTEVEIPGTTSELGVMAFRHNNLKDIVMPNSYKSYGNGVFLDNPIENIVIKKPEMEIGVMYDVVSALDLIDSLSNHNRDLKNIYFEKNNASYWTVKSFDLFITLGVSIFINQSEKNFNLVDDAVEVVKIDSREAFWDTVRLKSMF